MTRRAKDGSKYLNESLQKGLSVLGAVAACENAVGVTEIAKVLDLDYSTTYRLMSTLLDLGYLERDPDSKSYRVGPAVLRLGFAYASGLSARAAALPIMTELNHGLHETVNLSVRDGVEMVLIESLQSPNLLTTSVRIGGRYPLHCSASGKVAIAELPEPQREYLLRSISLDAFTPKTIRSARAFRSEVAKVMERGYATNIEEHVVGLQAVAAPIRDYRGVLTAVLDISVPTARVGKSRTLRSFADHVRDAAAQISRGLGWVRS